MQVNFHTTLSGQAMVTMIYHKKLGPEWQAAAEKLRRVLGACPSSAQPAVDLIGRSHKQKLELERGFVIERLAVDGRTLTYKQVRPPCTLLMANISSGCCYCRSHVPAVPGCFFSISLPIRMPRCDGVHGAADHLMDPRVRWRAWRRRWRAASASRTGACARRC